MSETASDGTDVEKPLEGRILTVYDLVAKLLPIEGRDYELNPSINERGSVSFNPEYHTEIGRIWVGYLAKMLPRLAMVPPLMRDQFIENLYPEVPVAQEKSDEDGKDGSSDGDGEKEQPGAV